MFKWLKNIWNAFNKKRLAKKILKLGAKFLPEHTVAHHVVRIVGEAIKDGNEDKIDFDKLPSGIRK